MPTYLKAEVPVALARDLWTTLIVLLAFCSGPIASFDAVFNEIAVWKYAVGWHSEMQPDGSVKSRYVDRSRNRWPLGLQSPEALSAHINMPDDLIYVHAQGRFCQPLDEPAVQRFRCNLGPEVKTLYLWLLFIAFALTAALAAAGLGQLALLRTTSLR